MTSRRHDDVMLTPDLLDFIVARAGNAPEYWAQWDPQAWAAAREVRESIDVVDRARGLYTVSETTLLPAWLRDEINGRVYPADDDPAPSLCTLWLEHTDWFALQTEHPDEFSVGVSYPRGTPITTEQVRQAWFAVQRASGIPMVGADLEAEGPWENPRFAVSVNAFYAVTSADPAELKREVSQLLGLSPRRPGLGGPISDEELVERGRERGLAGELHPIAWDWLYG